MKIKRLKIRHIPQYTFSSEIVSELNGIRASGNIDTIVDCPCGNGAVSIPLIENFKDTTFYCYDISQYEIRSFTNNIKRNNAVIKYGNIFDDNILEAPCDVWILVNSLFLLDDLKSLFVNLKKSSYVIVIIPNIESNSYKRFIKENVNVNKHSFTANEVSTLFQNNKFSEVTRKGISYLPRGSNKTIWSLLKYFTFLDRFPLLTSTHQYTLLTFKNGN